VLREKARALLSRVKRLTRNEQVSGSSPLVGSRFSTRAARRGLISGLAQLVVSVDSSERLGKLAEALESLPKVGEEGRFKEVALEAARMRKLARVLQDQACLREVFFRTGEIEDPFEKR
jgi:hypothetical protein